MIKIKTRFQGLYIFKNKINRDKRGHLIEIYNQKFLNKKFLFEYYSYSIKNVLRGLHFQRYKQQAKLIIIVKGKIIDVCLDLRKDSTTFGKYFVKTLSKDSINAIYIPEGFAHGFVTLNKENILLYKNSSHRNVKYEAGIKWNDSKLNIKWPKKKFIISKKDQNNMTYKNFLKKIKYL